MQQPINNNKRQTVVEWFAEQIESGKIEIVYSDKIHSIKCIPEIIQQAKELFEQQIKDACQQGFYDGLDMAKTKKSKFKSAEQYYNETFKTKKP
jgi:hypothetical protein